MIDAAHHVIHSTGNVLTDSTADRHTCHHSGHVETISTAAQIHIARTICSHLTESLCTSHANLCLLLNLESTEVRRLSLLMLCILTFFTLNAESTFIVFGFNTLFCVNVPDFCFCFGFCSSTCESLGYAHKLTIAFAGLVNFNRTNINPRHNDTECFFQSFAEIVFHNIVNLCRLAFNLNYGNVVSRRSVGNRIFHIAVDRITNLLLKIVKVERAEFM